MSFTFYQLVRHGDVYILRPHITIYPELLEIESYR